MAQALFEEAVYDSDGLLKNPTLADYLVPSAAEFPSFKMDFTVTPSPTNELGVKGVGRGRDHRVGPGRHQRHRRRLDPQGRHRHRHAGHPRTGVGRGPRRETSDSGCVRLRAGPARPRRRSRCSASTATTPSCWPAGIRCCPLMKLRLASPSVLIDIGRISDLSYIRDAGDHVAIGALTRHHDVEFSDLLKEQAPLVAWAVGHVGDPRCGTSERSAARPPTATRHPTCRRCCWPRGRRWWPRVPTARGRSRPTTSSPASSRPRSSRPRCSPRSGYPRRPAAGYGFEKFTRRAQDWAIVGVAVQARNGGAGVAW